MRIFTTINFCVFSHVYEGFGRSDGSESAKAHFGHFGALGRSKNSQVDHPAGCSMNFDGFGSPNGTWGTLGVSHVHLGAGGVRGGRPGPGIITLYRNQCMRISVGGGRGGRGGCDCRATGFPLSSNSSPRKMLPPTSKAWEVTGKYYLGIWAVGLRILSFGP